MFLTTTPQVKINRHVYTHFKERKQSLRQLKQLGQLHSHMKRIQGLSPGLPASGLPGLSFPAAIPSGAEGWRGMAPKPQRVHFPAWCEKHRGSGGADEVILYLENGIISLFVCTLQNTKLCIVLAGRAPGMTEFLEVHCTAAEHAWPGIPCEEEPGSHPGLVPFPHPCPVHNKVLTIYFPPTRSY